MDRVILHSDCNCFYASVEMLYHPELSGKPLAVGGDEKARHGIVLTANYEAKKRGVKTGILERRGLLPTNPVSFIRFLISVFVQNDKKREVVPCLLA